MPHETPLISTIVAALVLAFVLGAIANRGRRLKTRQVPLFLIESDDANVVKLTTAGFEAIAGNAADPDVINAANIGGARCLMVAMPDAFEGGQVVVQARAINPGLPIIARSHSDEETVHLKAHGATRVIMGEEEIGLAMLAELARL